MRAGTDFAKATKTVMEDAVFQNDIMAASIQPVREGPRTPRKGPPGARSRSPPGSTTPTRQLCNNFAKGTCRMGDRCRYIHADDSRNTKGKGKGKRRAKPVGARD